MSHSQCMSISTLWTRILALDNISCRCCRDSCSLFVVVCLASANISHYYNSWWSLSYPRSQSSNIIFSSVVNYMYSTYSLTFLIISSLPPICPSTLCPPTWYPTSPSTSEAPVPFLAALPPNKILGVDSQQHSLSPHSEFSIYLFSGSILVASSTSIYDWCNHVSVSLSKTTLILEIFFVTISTPTWLLWLHFLVCVKRCTKPLIAIIGACNIIFSCTYYLFQGLSMYIPSIYVVSCVYPPDGWARKTI